MTVFDVNRLPESKWGCTSYQSPDPLISKACVSNSPSSLLVTGTIDRQVCAPQQLPRHTLPAGSKGRGVSALGTQPGQRLLSLPVCLFSAVLFQSPITDRVLVSPAAWASYRGTEGLCPPKSLTTLHSVRTRRRKANPGHALGRAHNSLKITERRNKSMSVWRHRGRWFTFCTCICFVKICLPVACHTQACRIYMLQSIRHKLKCVQLETKPATANFSCFSFIVGKSKRTIRMRK